MSERLPPATVPPSSPGRHPAWLLALAVLVVWQGWLTLGLFGQDDAWRRLVDDRPIVSGRHPLHLYHGYLGARSFLERGQLSCYDPAFHAGYPKTPVFDDGSRPAELALALGGGGFSPAAYKIGQAVLCLLVPLLVYVGGRGAELSRAAAVLAAGLALAVWWGGPGREALQAGDGDLLLAALMALAQAGLLVRYHQHSCVLALGGVVLCGFLGWFAQPLFMVLLLPLFLVYYLSAGIRHRLAWHLPLLAGLVLAVGGNAFWLVDWVGYWWIRVPPGLDTTGGVRLAELWQAPLWGSAADRAFAAALLGFALVGTVVLFLTGRRPAARLVGLGAIGLFGLVLAGAHWPVLDRLGTGQLFVPALLFAGIPAASALGWGLDRLRRWSGTVLTPVVVLAGVPALVWLAAAEPSRTWAERLAWPEPFEIGLGEEREALVEALREETSEAARVLWQDRRGARDSSRWTALLAVLTERAFVGGLDDGAGIEHATSGLLDEVLAGRALAEWSDGELAEYCRRYNVGWVVCRSPGARDRFARWPAAGVGRELPGSEEERHWLFRIDRPHSFALEGSVRWRAADERGILLADAVPARPEAGEGEGQIVLSLHYQAGMRVSPSRVRIEQALDSRDAIAFVRLRMREPVGRILITWDSR